ncbi:MAG: transposase [Oscillospiraceae bacterium]|nr:transposase [Oscillospiraceae bacterium]
MICPAGKRFFYLKSSHVKGNQYGRTQEYYQCENCEGCELKGNCHRSKGNRITYMFRSKNYY